MPCDFSSSSHPPRCAPSLSSSLSRLVRASSSSWPLPRPRRRAPSRGACLVAGFPHAPRSQQQPPQPRDSRERDPCPRRHGDVRDGRSPRRVVGERAVGRGSDAAARARRRLPRAARNPMWRLLPCGYDTRSSCTTSSLQVDYLVPHWQPPPGVPGSSAFEYVGPFAGARPGRARLPLGEPAVAARLWRKCERLCGAFARPLGEGAIILDGAAF